MSCKIILNETNQTNSENLLENENNDEILNEVSAGNYTIPEPEDINVYSTNEIFDRSLVELSVTIPPHYKAFPVEFLLEQKDKLIKSLINNIQSNDADMDQFGFRIQIVIRIFKQNIAQDNVYEHLYITSHRYIITFNDLPSIFTLITQYISDRIFDLLFKTANSGWQIDEMTVLKLIYHRVYARNRIGYFNVNYPCKRGKKLVFNPIGVNEEDDLCILRCLAAHVKKKSYGANINKNNWKYMRKYFKNPDNIFKYIKVGKIKHVNFDDIAKLEGYNKIKINLYKLYKEENSDRYNIQMMKRGNKRYNYNVCNLVLFKYKNKFNTITWHC